MLNLENWREIFFRKIEPLRGTGVRGLAENFASLAVLQAATYLLPLITVPYLVRVLGVELFGLVAFAQAVIQYFIIVVDFGFNFSATREIAANRDDPDRVSRIFCGVFVVKITLLIIGYFVLWILTELVGRLGQDPRIFLIAYGLVVGNVLFPVWFFQGIERMKYSTAMVLLARAIFVALIFVLVRSAEDYLLVPALNAAGMVVAGLISLWIAFAKFGVKIRIPTRTELAEQIRGSFQYFLASLSSSVSASFNTLMLGLLTSNEMVGIYAAAEKVLVAMRSAFYPITRALYPYMTRQRNVLLFRKVLALTISSALLMGAAVVLFAPTVSDVLFGSGYEASASIIRVFAVAVPFLATSMLLGYPLLAAFGYENWANGANITGALAHIALITALSTVLTGLYAAGALVVTEAVILSVKVYGVKKHRLLSVPPVANQ